MENLSKQAADTLSSYISKTSGLKTKDYLGYALGDAAGCLVFSLVTSLLQKFYTDIFSIQPMYIMVMFVLARIWDAVNDPIMGRICDSVKITKYGRYKPWFLYVALPLSFTAMLMFAKWPGIGDPDKYTFTCVYATVTYVLFGMAYTMLQIPYGSLAAVVTTDEKERNKLSIWRSVGAGVGAMPVLLITSFCYSTDENGVKTMMYKPIIIGVIIMSLASACLLVLCFFMNKERIIAKGKEAETEEEKLKHKHRTAEALKNLFKNRAFIGISLTAMLLLAGQMFTQSFYTYLFDYYFNANWMNLIATGCNYAPMVVLMFFTPKLVRKFGKRELCAVGLTLSCGANLALFFMKGIDPSILMYLFMAMCFISGCGLTFISLQLWSMETDALDDLEVKTKQRDDATAYSIFNFFRKLGQVIAAIAVNGALMGMGYIVGNVAQGDENLNIMYILATLIPAVMYGLMALFLFVIYPLSKKKVEELQIEKEKNIKEAYENNRIIINEN